jgi:hypothetical protein
MVIPHSRAPSHSTRPFAEPCSPCVTSADLQHTPVCTKLSSRLTAGLVAHSLWVSYHAYALVLFKPGAPYRDWRWTCLLCLSQLGSSKRVAVDLLTLPCLPPNALLEKYTCRDPFCFLKSETVLPNRIGVWYNRKPLNGGSTSYQIYTRLPSALHSTETLDATSHQKT